MNPTEKDKSKPKDPLHANEVTEAEKESANREKPDDNKPPVDPERP